MDGIKNILTSKISNLSQDFVDEYLTDNAKFRRLAPNTIQMKNLYNELVYIDNNIKNSNNKVDTNTLANEWSADYNSNIHQNYKSQQLQGLQWSTEYLAETESNLYNNA